MKRIMQYQKQKKSEQVAIIYITKRIAKSNKMIVFIINQMRMLYVLHRAESIIPITISLN